MKVENLAKQRPDVRHGLVRWLSGRSEKVFVTGDRQGSGPTFVRPQAQAGPFGSDRADAGEAKVGVGRQPLEPLLPAEGNREQQLVVLAALQGDLSRVESICCGIGSASRREGE